MNVAKYIDDRIKIMLTNKHSTQGYECLAEGNPCTLQDPSITPINPMVYGCSAEVGDLVDDANDENHGKYCVPIKVRGKNLLPIKTSGENTGYGVTLEYNSDGSIHVLPATSTNTAVWNFTSSKYDGNRFKLNINGTLTLSMPVVAKNTIYLTLGRCRNDKVTYVDTRVGNISIDVVETDEFVVYIQIAKTVTLPEMTLYPQIELGKSATAWEPYFAPKTVNVYLDEPLRQTELGTDYIDWEKGIVKQLSNEPQTEQSVVLPKLSPVPHSMNIVSVETENKGDLKVKYHSFTKEE